jgi:hypothetical protein
MSIFQVVTTLCTLFAEEPQIILLRLLVRPLLALEEFLGQQIKNLIAQSKEQRFLKYDSNWKRLTPLLSGFKKIWLKAGAF